MSSTDEKFTKEELGDILDSDLCIFCGRDPYHYVDNGVGWQPVAVECCDLGIGLYQYRDELLQKVSNKISKLAVELLEERKKEEM